MERDQTVMYCDGYSYVDTVSRIIKEPDAKERELVSKQESHSRSCLLIRYNDTAFVIRKVNQMYGPMWTHKLAVEYRQEYGRIPEKKEREAIAELLSFLIGRHLILVGETSYVNGYAVKAKMFQPNTSNIMQECNTSTRELVPVHMYFDERENLRNFMETLLPIYLKKRDVYGMEDAFCRYWMAHAMPIGVNLSIVSGALEILMKSWFNG